MCGFLARVLAPRICLATPPEFLDALERVLTRPPRSPLVLERPPRDLLERLEPLGLPFPLVFFFLSGREPLFRGTELQREESFNKPLYLE